MRHTLTVIAILVAFSTALGPSTTAEVRVKTDPRGIYSQTQVIASGPRWSPRIWALTNRSDGPQALNAQGDLNGDLWPVVRESEVGERYPLVVWSRRNGPQYDLAWSRWVASSGWEPIRWIGANPGGDDLDADVGFDAGGLPHVAWWRNEGGTGRIYVSVMVAQGWIPPYPVTDGVTDSRYPALELLADGMVRVSYETPTGSVSQLVAFDEPVTITEDINPLQYYRLAGEPVFLGASR